MEPKTDREIMFEMKGDMNLIASTMKQISDTMIRIEDVKMKELEKRITSLERRFYIAMGAVAIIGYIIKVI